MSLKPLTYSIDNDNGVLSISIKDTTNYSGTGNKSLSAYIGGVRFIFYGVAPYSNRLLYLGSEVTPSVPILSALNNTEYIATIPVAGVSGTVEVFSVIFPLCDITLNVSTTFNVGDVFCAYNTGTSSYDLYLCMVNSPNTTIAGNIVLITGFDMIPTSVVQSISVVINEPTPNPFQVSLGIQIDCQNTSFVISDETTYIIDGSEPSLEVDEFNGYTIVTVTPPVGDTFTVATGYPATNGMYDISIDITELGDGLYVFNYYNVPSFDDTQTYQTGMAVVDSSGQLWLNNYGATNSLSNFTEITQEELPSQYTFTQAFVVACTRLGCSIATYQTAFCGNCGNCDKCCNNKAFGQTAKTGVLLDYLNNGFTSEQKLLSNYSEQVSNVLTALNTICQF